MKHTSRTSRNSDTNICEELRAVIRFMDTHNLTELNWQKPRTRIAIKRGNNHDASDNSLKNASTAAHKSDTAVKRDAHEEKHHARQHALVAPIVGTCYLTPSPSAKPFIEQGQDAQKGQTLCIIEAMKIMNEIKAEYRCRIDKVLVSAGEFVRTNQPLFVLTPLD